jgi:hypothetical protein
MARARRQFNSIRFSAPMIFVQASVLARVESALILQRKASALSIDPSSDNIFVNSMLIQDSNC